jgi:multiple sugar transport system ATP-binding protein
MATVTMRGITKSYSDYAAVRGIDLNIANEEFVVFVGPSGCGKSTTLRMIAGLEDITSGDMIIGDRRVNDLGPGDRDIAMVFQNYALYPHMTVEENISFGLRQRNMPREEIRRRVREAADMLQLTPLLSRKPRALSGGQRQRVAMGRAIVRNPKVFLFDEPLSNLDAKLRVQMRTEIKRLHQQIPTTTVYVTHDQIEAMTMADRVVVMNKGLVEQVGPPAELYNAPQTLFVAGFIGSPAMNFIPAKIEENGGHLIAHLPEGNDIVLPQERYAAYAATAGKDMLIGLRPEIISEPDEQSGRQMITAEVVFSELLGAETLVYFLLNGVQYCCRTSPGFMPRSGERVKFSLDLARMHLLDPQTERVISPQPAH